MKRKNEVRFFLTEEEAKVIEKLMELYSAVSKAQMMKMLIKMKGKEIYEVPSGSY